jgi:hypothetical protein
VIYVPYQQAPAACSWISGVRTAGDPLRIGTGRSPRPSARWIAKQPITDMRTHGEKAIHNNAIGLNYMAALMGVFGALALVPRRPSASMV